MSVIEPVPRREPLFERRPPLAARRGSMGGPAAADAAGITYRQLHRWCELGVVRAAREANGSGSQRLFTARQVAMLRVLGALAGTGARAPVLGAVWSCLADVDDLSGWVVVGDGDRVEHVADAETLAVAVTELGLCRVVPVAAS